MINVNFFSMYMQISNGADVNVRDSLGRVPLHAACVAQDQKLATRTIELLLEAGAEPGLADELGMTPAHLTALAGWYVLSMHYMMLNTIS